MTGQGTVFLDRTPKVGETIRLWSRDTGQPVAESFTVGALDASHRPIPAPYVGDMSGGIICGHGEMWELVAEAPQPAVDVRFWQPPHRLALDWLDAEILRFDGLASDAKERAKVWRAKMDANLAEAAALDARLDSLTASRDALLATLPDTPA